MNNEGDLVDPRIILEPLVNPAHFHDASQKVAKQLSTPEARKRHKELVNAMRRLLVGKPESGAGEGGGPDDDTVESTEPPDPSEPGEPKGPGSNTAPLRGEDEIADDHSRMFEDQDGNPIDPKKTEATLRQMARAAQRTSKDYGNLPGFLQGMLEELYRVPEIDWRTKIRRTAGNAVRINKEGTWKRPNRRFGSDFKGTKTVQGPDIVVVIDTSCSIFSDPAQLGQFVAEINAISSLANVTAVEVDMVIQRVRKWKRGIGFEGGGGTDFRPVFEALISSTPHPKDPQRLLFRRRPKLIIYLTDGDGQFPDRNPTNAHVLWVYTIKSNLQSHPFGEGIYLPVKDK